jgi:hypothetical protein
MSCHLGDFFEGLDKPRRRLTPESGAATAYHVRVL